MPTRRAMSLEATSSLSVPAGSESVQWSWGNHLLTQLGGCETQWQPEQPEQLPLQLHPPLPFFLSLSIFQMTSPTTMATMPPTIQFAMNAYLLQGNYVLWEAAEGNLLPLPQLCAALFYAETFWVR